MSEAKAKLTIEVTEKEFETRLTGNVRRLVGALIISMRKDEVLREVFSEAVRIHQENGESSKKK